MSIYEIVISNSFYIDVTHMCIVVFTSYVNINIFHIWVFDIFTYITSAYGKQDPRGNLTTDLVILKKGKSHGD